MTDGTGTSTDQNAAVGATTTQPNEFDTIIQNLKQQQAQPLGQGQQGQTQTNTNLPAKVPANEYEQIIQNLTPKSPGGGPDDALAAFNRGIANVAGAPADAAAWAVRKSMQLAGIGDEPQDQGAAPAQHPQTRPPQTFWGRVRADLEHPLAGSEDFTETMRNAGIPVDPVSPNSPAAIAGSGAADMLGWEGALRAGWGKVAEAIPYVGRKVAPLIEKLTHAGSGSATNVAGSIGRSAIVGGGSAVTGHEAGLAAGELVPPRYKAAAETLGETTGQMVGGGFLDLGLNAAERAIQLGETGIKQLVRPFYSSGRDILAGQRIKDTATSPTATLAELRAPSEGDAGGVLVPGVGVEPGSQPTSFEVTGDYGIGALTREARNRNGPAFIQRAAEQNTARRNAILAQAGAGDPSAPANYLTQSLNDIDAAGATNVAAARNFLDTKLRDVGGQQYQTTGAYGADLRQQLADAAATEKTSVGRLWTAIDPNGVLRVRTDALKAKAQEIASAMSANAKPMEGEEKAIFDMVGTQPGEIPFSEMKPIRQRISAEIRRLTLQYGTTESPDIARLMKLKEGLDGALDDSVRNGSTAFSARDLADYENAIMGTAKYKQTFRQGPVGDFLRMGNNAGRYSMADATGIQSFFSSAKTVPEKFPALVRAFGGDRARAVQAIGDYAAFDMRNTKGLIKPDGSIDTGKLQGWMLDHREMFAAVPELGARFSDLQSASQALDDAVAQHLADRATVAEGAASKFLGDASTPQAVKNNFAGGGDKSFAAFDRLMNLAAADPTGQATLGLRHAVIDHVLSTAELTTEAGTTGDVQLSANNLQKFLKTNERALRRVLGDDGFGALDAVGRDMQRQGRLINATKLAGGSNTPQDLAAAEAMGHGAQSLLGWVMHHAVPALLGAAGAGAAHGVGQGLTHVAIAGGATWAATAALNAARARGMNMVDQLVTEATLNPALMKRLLAAVPAKRATPDYLASATRAILNSAISGAPRASAAPSQYPLPEVPPLPQQARGGRIGYAEGGLLGEGRSIQLGFPPGSTDTPPPSSDEISRGLSGGDYLPPPPKLDKGEGLATKLPTAKAPSGHLPPTESAKRWGESFRDIGSSFGDVLREAGKTGAAVRASHNPLLGGPYSLNRAIAAPLATGAKLLGGGVEASIDAASQIIGNIVADVTGDPDQAERAGREFRGFVDYAQTISPASFKWSTEPLATFGELTDSPENVVVKQAVNKAFEKAGLSDEERERAAQKLEATLTAKKEAEITKQLGGGEGGGGGGEGGGFSEAGRRMALAIPQHGPLLNLKARAPSLAGLPTLMPQPVFARGGLVGYAGGGLVPRPFRQGYAGGGLAGQTLVGPPTDDQTPAPSDGLMPPRPSHMQELLSLDGGDGQQAPPAAEPTPTKPYYPAGIQLPGERPLAQHSAIQPPADYSGGLLAPMDKAIQKATGWTPGTEPSWTPQWLHNLSESNKRYEASIPAKERQVMDLAMGFAGPIEAFHGSPHLFDAFDYGRVGTGTGESLHGLGLNFAENPYVAEIYKKRAAQAAGIPGRGHLYKAELPDEPDNYLDWDRPLAGQSPQVQKALHDNGLVRQGENPTGQQIHTATGKGDPAQAAANLRAAGIPGVRWLEQAAGIEDPSYNYLTFKGTPVRMLKREYTAGEGLAAGEPSGSVAPSVAPPEGEEGFRPEGFTKEQYDRHVQIISDAAHEHAANLGFKGPLIVDRNEPPHFTLNGEDYTTGGSFTPHTGEIHIYPGAMPTDFLPQAIAHEIMHAKWHAALDARSSDMEAMDSIGDPKIMREDGRLNPNWEQTFPAYHALYDYIDPKGTHYSELRATGAKGITDYAKSHWDAVAAGDSHPATAINETLAEIAGLENKGRPQPGQTGHLGFGTKGGAGFNGKITKIEGNQVHIVNPEGKTYQGPLRHWTPDSAFDRQRFVNRQLGPRWNELYDIVNDIHAGKIGWRSPEDENTLQSMLDEPYIGSRAP